MPEWAEVTIGGDQRVCFASARPWATLAVVSNCFAVRRKAVWNKDCATILVIQ